MDPTGFDLCERGLSVSVFSRRKLEKGWHTFRDTLSQDKHWMNEQQLKYLIGRLIKLYDVVWETQSVIENGALRIRQIIEELFSYSFTFTAEEFAHFIFYLEDSYASVNGDLFPYIWRVERQVRFFKHAEDEVREKVLLILLELNRTRLYSHSIVDFKRILSFTTSKDTAIEEVIRQKPFVYKSACHQVITYLFKHFPTETIEQKTKWVLWLDNAVGPQPKSPWLNKLDKLKEEGQSDNLRRIAKYIVNPPEPFEDDENGLMNNEFRRFYKSATWYLTNYEGIVMKDRIVASVYRLGLLVGYFLVEDVVQWADRVIEQNPVEDIPSYYYELSLKKDKNGVIEILDEISGPTEDFIPGRILLGLLYEKWDDEQSEQIIKMCDSLNRLDGMGSEDATILYVHIDQYEQAQLGYGNRKLSKESVQANIEEVKEGIFEYLQEYKPYASLWRSE